MKIFKDKPDIPIIRFLMAEFTLGTHYSEEIMQLGSFGHWILPDTDRDSKEHQMGRSLTITEL